jgi:hypothetical protein
MSPARFGHRSPCRSAGTQRLAGTYPTLVDRLSGHRTQRLTRPRHRLPGHRPRLRQFLRQFGVGRNHRPRWRRPHHRPRLGGPPWRRSGPAYHDRAGRRRRRWRSHARRRRRRLHAGLGRRLHDAQSWRNRLTRAAENLPWLRRRSRNRGRNDPARGCSAHGCGRFLCWRRRLFGGRRSSARFSHRGRCRLHRRSRRRSRRSRWRYDGRRGCPRGSRFDRSAPCQRGTNRLRGSGDDGRQIGRCCGWRRSRRGRLGGGDWWGLNRRRRSRLGLHARSSFRRCFGHGRRCGFRRKPLPAALPSLPQPA